MKRIISLLLMVCLLAVSLPAGASSVRRIRPGQSSATDTAEAEPTEIPPEMREKPEIPLIPGAGYDFDFVIRINEDAIAQADPERIRGYAALVESLRFQGSYSWALNGESFDLRLNIIPVNYSAGTVEMWIRGAEDLMFVDSNLLGEKTIALRCQSMLAFFAKMSEHLGLPLQYLGMLYPYSWKFCLSHPLADWQAMVEEEDENGIISAEAVYQLGEWWKYRRDGDEPLMILLNALCMDSDLEDTFRALFYEITDYFIRQVAQEQEIRIIREDGNTTWETASGVIYRGYESETERRMEWDLPRMEIGYQPVFSLETFRENGCVSGRLRAQLLSGSTEPDVLNLEASLVAFPETWPVDNYSLLSVSLTGGLLPNVGFSCVMGAEKNGHVQVDLRKPTVDGEPGAVMITLDGEVLPREGEVQVREFALEDEWGALDLFIANDTTIMAFLPDLVEPMLKGMLQFLVGIPTNACQAVMDDLTDLGVFQVLMGE